MESYDACPKKLCNLKAQKSVGPHVTRNSRFYNFEVLSKCVIKVLNTDSSAHFFSTFRNFFCHIMQSKENLYVFAK